MLRKTSFVPLISIHLKLVTNLSIIAHPLPKHLQQFASAFHPPQTDLHDELDRYLSTDEHVTDALAWWHEKQLIYLCLHQMALDYLTIPGEFSC